MIARKSTLSMIAYALGAMLNFVSLFFIARYMGPNVLGIIGFALSFLGLFGFIGYLGFNTAHIKRVSEGMDFDKCIGTYSIVKIILAGCMATVVIGTISIWKFVSHGIFESPTHEIVLYILLISVIVTNLADIMLMTFAARKETAKQQIPTLIGRIVRTAMVVIVVFASLGIFALAGAYILSSIAILLSASFLFRGYPIGKPDKQYFKRYLVFAMPMMIAVMSGSIFMNVDKVMIQSFCGTEAVGYYFGAQRLIMFFSFVGGAVSLLLLPTISSYSTKNNHEQIEKTTLLAERYLSMISFPILTFSFLFSKPIIFIILGNAFLPGAAVLSIFSIVMWFMITTTPFSSQISGLDKPGIIGKTCVLALIINVFFNLLLIPKQLMGIKLLGLGIGGAAIATLFSWLVMAIVYRLFAYKLTKTKPNPRIVLHLLSASITGISLHFIGIKLPVYHWYWLLGLALLGFVIYFGLLYLMREFTKKDFEFFISTLNPKEMAKYIKDEMMGSRK